MATAPTLRRLADTHRIDVDRVRRIDGIFDLVLRPSPDGGLTTSDGTRPLTAGQLAALVRRNGGAGCDVRLLAADGGTHRALLSALATELGRDVLAAPAGTDVHYLAGFGLDADAVEAVPVDRTSGRPGDWLLVRAATTAPLPGWYELSGGLIWPRSGMVRVPLPGGFGLASRDDFVPRRAEAGRLGSGHPGLTTLAATVVDGGDFVLGDYAGGTSIHSGRTLAAALAELPLGGDDIRLWLSWPASAGGQARLSESLAELAEATGAVLWAPPVGGRSEVREPHRDLVALDREGLPAAWLAVRPRGGPGAFRFESDVDGRLVPAGGLVVDRWPGVGLVSVPAPRVRRMMARYEELVPSTGLFIADLAVLADGRVAARRADDAMLALGAGALSQLLRRAGWSGEDLLLLTTVNDDQCAGLTQWAAAVSAALGCDIWTAVPGGEVVVDDGPRLRLPDGRSGTWRQVGSPAATASPARWRTDRGWLVPASDSPGAAPAPRLLAPRSPGGLAPLRFAPAPAKAPPHGLYWLPEDIDVNADPIDVYVGSPWDVARSTHEGVPSPELFLVAGLDRDALARQYPGGCVLRVRVQPGGAAGMTAGALHAAIDDPPASDPAGRVVIPAGWLDRAGVVEGFAIGEGGEVWEGESLPALPLLLRSTGAAHGADGLPHDVQYWPHRRPRSGSPTYALLPDSGRPPAVGWLELFKNRPAPAAGERAVALTVAQGQAIDVRASAVRLKSLPSLRTELADLHARGVRLILPSRSYPRVSVAAMYATERGSWRAQPIAPGLTLHALLDAGPP